VTADGTYRPGARVTSVDQLDALPVGSVVLADATHQESPQDTGSYPLAFQKLYDGKWHRGGRSRDTDPDFITPATVLFRPDAPQPATTDDAVERAAWAILTTRSNDASARQAQAMNLSAWRDALAEARAALAAASAGAEHECADERLAEPGPLCRQCGMPRVGAVVDRETIGVLPSAEGLTAALRWLAEQEGVREDWYAEEVPAIMVALTAAGAGAEVERACPEVECPGMFVGWSAFGATYPDTVCATSLTWPEGHDPGPVLCDADDDHRPKGIPCPACDPQGFAQYEDDPAAPLAVYRLAGLIAARGDAATPTEVEWGVRMGPRPEDQIVVMDEERARWHVRTQHDAIDDRLVQRTVSAWREVRD